MPSTYNSELWTDHVAGAFGDKPNYYYERKFGEVLCVSANTEYSVAYGSNTRILRRFTETTFTIVSTSASDASAGVGVRTMRVFGYKADFSQEYEDVTLNGTTPVNLTGTYIEVYRAYVLTCGTTRVNVGNIVISTTAGTVHMTIQALHGQSQACYYIVPKGKKTQLIDLYLGVEKSGANPTVVAFRLLRWNIFRTNFREVYHILIDQEVEYNRQLSFPFSEVFTEGELIEFTAISTVANTPVRVVAYFIDRDV